MGIVLILYGVFVLGCGVLGFRLNGSRSSLMMGAASGMMLAVSGALVLLGNSSGANFGVGVTYALVLVFGMRYARTRMMVPAGMMLAASILVAVLLYARLFT